MRFLCLFATVCLAAHAAFAEGRDQFAARIRAAFAAPDKPVALRELFHLEGVDADQVEMYEKRIIGRMLLRMVAPTVGFEPLPADFDPVYVRDGYEYRPNLTPVGYVVLNGKTRLIYGEHNGRFRFPGVTKTAVDPDAPPDRMLQMMVLGIGHPAVRYVGHCDVMQSNDRLKRMTLEDSGIGNTTVMIMARQIERCELTKISPHGTLRLRLQEGDNVSFEQRVDRQGATITYQR